MTEDTSQLMREPYPWSVSLFHLNNTITQVHQSVPALSSSSKKLFLFFTTPNKLFFTISEWFLVYSMVKEYSLHVWVRRPEKQHNDGAICVSLSLVPNFLKYFSRDGDWKQVFSSYMQYIVIEMVSKCKTLCTETTQLRLHLSFEHFDIT